MWEKPKLRLLTLSAAIFLLAFNLKNSTVFVGNWRNIDDLREVSEIISGNINEEKINIATIRKDSDFFERNSVDYRYFVETFGKKNVLDWEPKDYERASILFVVDEAGNTDVINTNIMEISIFKPGKIAGIWETEKGIKVYKILKKN